MTFEDFLAPELPGLIYETHSEQSHSPKSAHDTSLLCETEWLNWDHKNDENYLGLDPIVTTAQDDFFNAQMSYGDVLSTLDPENFDGVNCILDGDATKVVTPYMLDKNHAVLADCPSIVQPTDTRVQGTKRKLSGCSDDSASDAHSRSSSSVNHTAEDARMDATSNMQRTTVISRRPPKVSHNVIEKRYRSNLNEKINVLRDAVPAMKAEAETAGAKHPKGRIIQAATDYIKDIEAKCARLQEDNNRLLAKLHGEPRAKSGGTLAKVVVGGLATMMCVSSPLEAAPGSAHAKRALEQGNLLPKSLSDSIVQNGIVILKMLLLIAAVIYIFNPDLFTSAASLSRERNNEKYSQTALDDSMQEDLQENREAMHDNVSAMLGMPRDRPGLFKRILQGCFVLFFEILLGQSGWNALINRGLDYALTRQNACSMLIETQLLGADKRINQAKLFLSAIQSLGYRMPKEMRALHFAMVCHGYAPVRVVQWCVALFWSTPDTGHPVLQLPLEQLLSARVLEAMWAWTTGIDDPLIANVRNDETIDTPLKQLSSIHAALLQNQLLRQWLRGSETTTILNQGMTTLLEYCPSDSKILRNSLYLKNMIEPNDWLERAMLESISKTSQLEATSRHDVAMQLRCCVLLNLLDKNPQDEEVSDVLQMAEVETSSLLPGHSSRIVANCIAKHRLDDDEGISDALRRIFAKIGGSSRMELHAQ